MKSIINIEFLKHVLIPLGIVGAIVIGTLIFTIIVTHKELKKK